MEISAERLNFDGRMPHLLCKKEDIADVVLLPGDPARVKMFADLCDGYKIVAENREFLVGTGSYQGYPFSVCSTGIGGPSTEIAAVELIELGAKSLIRIGGTGVITPDVRCGDMVINTAAMRMGGSSSFYAPPEYPAVASFEVTQCLIDACRNAGVTYTKGLCASVGSFFAAQGRPVLGERYYDEDLLEQYRRLKIINLEMESETIMVLGGLLGVMTGSICAVHANRTTDEWLYEFEMPQITMCKIALEAVRLLYERYLDPSQHR